MRGTLQAGDSAYDGRVTDSPQIPLAEVLNVAAIEADLADVEVALERLENGTYWTDEVTGAPLSEELLTARPTARRNVSNAPTSGSSTPSSMPQVAPTPPTS